MASALNPPRGASPAPAVRAAGTEIDLDQILERLADEIRREYKRFYGE
jgi:hypothetical protein